MKPSKHCSLFLNLFQSFLPKKKLKNLSLTIVLLTSVLSFPSAATEVGKVETDKYLLSSCNAFKETTDNDKTLPCVMYVKGFFNGLLNAGHSEVTKIDEGTKKTSTLVERAYANRVGKRSPRKPLSHSCITVDELKVLIIDTLSDDSTSDFVSVKQLNSFLIKTLTSACSPDK